MKAFTRRYLAFLPAAVAVLSAVMLAGCGDMGPVDDNNKNTGGSDESGLIGDWLLVGMSDSGRSTGGVWRSNRPYGHMKAFLTFKPSGEFIGTSMYKYENFWIETPIALHWRTSNQYVHIDGYLEKDEGGIFNISGNTLTITQISRYDGDTFSERMTFNRDNLTTFKSSVDKIYDTDSALVNTRWRLNENSLRFSTGYLYGADRYIDSYSAPWYTEGAKMFLLGADCNEYERGYDSAIGEEYENCVSYFVAETVELEYNLSNNGNLRLRPVNSDVWDEWTPYVYDYDGMNKRQSKISERYKHHQSALFGLVR
jgi:hypothetical protein